MVLAPDRYPTQLEKAGSYWFPIMKNYLSLPFFTQDEWNKEVTENIVPWTLNSSADTGLTPIYDDITISATNDMLQAIVVQGKSVEEGVKILADAADAAKAKLKMEAPPTTAWRREQGRSSTRYRIRDVADARSAWTRQSSATCCLPRPR